MGISRKTIVRTLQWSVTVGLVVVLVLVTDIRSTLRILLSADPWLLSVAIGVGFADRILMIGKWIPLVRVLLPGTEIVPAAKAYFGAMFASMFLPSSIGGDAVRAYAVGRADAQIPEVAVSIFVERALGFLALCLVATTALLTALGSAGASAEARSILPWVLAVGVAGVVVIGLPVFTGSVGDELKDGQGLWARIRRLWGRLIISYRRYADHRWRLAGVGLASVAEQLFPIGVIWLLAMALDVPAGVLAVAVATPIAMFVMRLPLAIDGLGVVEGALVYFLSLFGVPAEGALAIAVANRAVKTVVLLPGALFVSELRSIDVRQESLAPSRRDSGLPSDAG